MATTYSMGYNWGKNNEYQIMNYGLYKKGKKFTTGIIVFTILVASFSPVLAIPAQAQWLVADPGLYVFNTINQLKDFGLDSIAWGIVNIILQRIAASTVNWINSGFKGKPAFVTDPEAYFVNMADKLASQYIFSDPNLNFLCGPIKAKIRLALSKNYTQDKQWNCTLNSVKGNFESFMGDFSNGGWDNFFELTQKQQNNPLGAYIQAENELAFQISTQQGIAKDKLDWGRGFMSFEVCGPDGRDKDGTCIGRASIETPGSVIETSLNNVLKTGNDKLVVADEINEIVSALLNQLVLGVVGGIGKGLRSLSVPSSTKDSKVVDYFGNEQDTSKSKAEPPPPLPPIPTINIKISSSTTTIGPDDKSNQ